MAWLKVMMEGPERTISCIIMPKQWKITELPASSSSSCLYDSEKQVNIKMWWMIFYFLQKKTFKESYRILDFGVSLLAQESDTLDFVKECKREKERGRGIEGRE